MKYLLKKYCLVKLVIVILCITGIATAQDLSALQKRTPTLAVLPFENTNTEAKERAFGASIAAILNTHIRNETNFVVLERSRLNQLFGEKQLDMAGMTDADRTRMGQMFSVEVLLTGEVAEIGGVLHIDARLISIQTGNVVVAEYVEVKDINTLREKLVALSRTIELKYLRQWIGSLTVVSAPVEGEVYIDEVYAGKASQAKPLVIEKLLEGQYKVRVIAGGYEEYKEVVQVKPKSNREIGVMLKSLPGSIAVSSEPTGARVMINGKDMGLAPLNLERLEKGVYNIRMQMDNYLDWSGVAIVEPGQSAEIKGQMKVIPGKLLISTVPEGVTVFLDSKKVGVTPVLVENIRPGTYQVLLEAPTYANHSVLQTIKPGQEHKIHHEMLKKTGKLTVLANLPDAKIQLFDGKSDTASLVFEQTLPIHKIPLNVGFYKMKVSRPSYFTQEEMIHITADKEYRTERVLLQKPGTLIVASAPVKGAKFYMDGNYEGTANIFEVPQGEHVLERQTFFETQVQTVQVQADSTTRSFLNQPKPGSSRWIIPLTTLGLILTLFSAKED
jgi:TolB-like protein